MPKYQRCLDCGLIKNVKEFYKHRGILPGRRANCKLCDKETRREKQEADYASGKRLAPPVAIKDPRTKNQCKTEWYRKKYPYQEDMWSAERLADYKKLMTQNLAKVTNAPRKPRSSKKRREKLRASAEAYLKGDSYGTTNREAKAWAKIIDVCSAQP